MQTIGNLSSARSILLAAGAFLCLITLGGCAGSGGGGGGLTPPQPFVYPASLKDATSSDTVDGFMSPYAINGTTSELVSVTPTVSGTTPSQGQISITINDITVDQPPAAPVLIEPGFTVTFDSNSTSGNLLWPSTPSYDPFESLATACNGCLKTAQAPATYIVGGGSAGQVTFTYLDSAAMGLTYSALGMWTKPTASGPLHSTWPEVGGAFSAGVLTRGIDLPTTGTAQYQGYLIGRYVTSNAVDPSTFNGGYPAGSYIVAASASATADFGANAITSFSTTDTHIALDTGAPAIAESRLDLNTLGTQLPISRTLTGNGFEGTAVRSTDTVNGVFTGSPGKIAGGFYGKPDTTTAPFAPPELGGSLSVTNGTGTQSMVGSFAMKKQ